MTLATQPPTPPHLVPLPARFGRTHEWFLLEGEVRYSLVGGGADQVTGAVRRFAAWLRAEAASEFAVVEDPCGPEAAALRITCSNAGSAPPRLGEDESYTLLIDETGIDLLAERPVGVLRGLATLQQILLANLGLPGIDVDRLTMLPGVAIDDRPRFPWRGLMIDVSRHFIPVEVLEQQIEAMALVKLNVLHLHLTDDQGFRVESHAFPALHGRGSDGQFYTQDELRGLVAYATDRGIRVVPEFDLPGHASSWLVGYPHLGCRPDSEYRIQDSWGCHDVCVDPTNDRLYEFLDRFFADVLPLFPDEFVHIGGDEVRGDEWRANSAVAAFMDARGMADVGALQAWFNARVREILARHGKRMMGWDEVVHPAVPRDAVVQSWRGPESVAAITAAGYSCVQSHGYYLDALLPASDHYLVDPVPADISDEQASLILGGEACIWTEFADADNLDTRIWPRAMAVAERLWSPATVRSVPSFEMRMHRFDPSRGRCEEQLTARLVGIAGEEDPAALAIVSGLLAPVPLDTCAPDPGLDRHTPLDRLVDVLLVESEQITSFRALLDDRPHALRVLRELAASCDAVEGHPAFGPLVRRIREFARIGCAAIEALESDAVQTQAWVVANCESLDTAAVPHGGVAIPARIIEPIRELVRAAGPELRYPGE